MIKINNHNIIIDKFLNRETKIKDLIQEKIKKSEHKIAAIDIFVDN